MAVRFNHPQLLVALDFQPQAVRVTTNIFNYI